MIIQKTITFIKKHTCEQPFSLWIPYLLIGVFSASLLLLFFTIKEENPNIALGVFLGLGFGFIVIPLGLLAGHSINYVIYLLSKGERNSYWDVLRIGILSWTPSAVCSFFLYANIFILQAANLEWLGEMASINMVLWYIGSFVTNLLGWIVYLIALKKIKGMSVLRYILIPIIFVLALLAVIALLRLFIQSTA